MEKIRERTANLEEGSAEGKKPWNFWNMDLEILYEDLLGSEAGSLPIIRRWGWEWPGLAGKGELAAVVVLGLYFLEPCAFEPYHW